MNKKDLTLLYSLYNEIGRIERSVIKPEFIDNWFVIFEDLREKFWDLYRTYDSDEFSILERLLSIIDNGMSLYDTELLKEEDKKKFNVKYRNWNMGFSDDWIEVEPEWDSEWIFITQEFREKCWYCEIEFKNVEEVIDYVLSKTQWNIWKK